MSDLVVTYKGDDIIDTSLSTTKTLTTAGQYLEDDIEITYVKPSGGITSEDLTLSGDLNNAFSYNRFRPLLVKYGDLFVFNHVTDISGMFQHSSLTNELENLGTINLSSCANASNMFTYSQSLTKLPPVSGTSVALGMSNMFSYCRKLPDTEIYNFLNSITFTSTPNYPNLNYMFRECYLLHDVTGILNILNQACSLFTTASSNQTNSATFQDCFGIYEITNFPVLYYNKAVTSNKFLDAVTNVHAAHEFQFVTDNGTPKVVSWKSQTLDLSSYFGYCSNLPGYLKDVSNLPLEDNIFLTTMSKDDYTYDLLKARYDSVKNKAHWYSCGYGYAVTDPDGNSVSAPIGFSPYNHDAAVRTINSLPDCSAYLATAGGTNTLKLRGNLGFWTDGGPVRALTAAEIQVATDKGWTVSIV